MIYIYDWKSDENNEELNSLPLDFQNILCWIEDSISNSVLTDDSLLTDKIYRDIVDKINEFNSTSDERLYAALKNQKYGRESLVIFKSSIDKPLLYIDYYRVNHIYEKGGIHGSED